MFCGVIPMGLTYRLHDVQLGSDFLRSKSLFYKRDFFNCKQAKSALFSSTSVRAVRRIQCHISIEFHSALSAKSTYREAHEDGERDHDEGHEEPPAVLDRLHHDVHLKIFEKGFHIHELMELFMK